MRGCMTAGHPDLTKHNFYADKSDAAAWTSYAAQPRSYQPPDRGSRLSLVQRRAFEQREHCEKLFDRNYKPKYSASRTSLISNWAIENS